MDDDARPPSQQRPPTAPRFPGFDGLRALAALSVVLFHIVNRDRRPAAQLWGRYAIVMNLGVPLFFMISGFLLYRPFVAARFSGRPALSTREFYRRRILRIIPGFWVAFTVVAVVFQVNDAPGRSWKWVLVNYGLLQEYVQTHARPGMALAWTIGTEMMFYALLPAYAWLLARGRTDDRRALLRRELLGFAALFFVSLAWRWFFKSWSFPPGMRFYDNQVSSWLPANTDYFGGGMLLAVLSVWFADRGEPRWVRSRWLPGVSWAVSFGAYALYVEVLYLRLAKQGESWSVALARHELFLVVVVAAAVPAALGPAGQGLIRRFLESRVMERLALVSFGTYLYHQAVIAFVYWVAGAENSFTVVFPHGPDYPFWLLAVASLALTLAVATASYHLVEAPFLRRKRRVGQATVTGPPAPASANEA